MEEYPVFKAYYDTYINATTYESAYAEQHKALSQTTDPVEQTLIRSLMDAHRFISRIDPDRFLTFVELITNTQSDTNRLCNEIKTWTQDVAQINTLNRLLSWKEAAKQVSIQKLYKPCPHCNTMYAGDNTTEYVVCGYNGSDTPGCSRDWCFVCGKKLCRSWCTDQLYNTPNRTHTSTCCKKYAASINDVYPDNYCKCSNAYVNRGREKLSN